MENGRIATSRTSGMPSSPNSRPPPFGNLATQAGAQLRNSQERPAISRTFSNSPVAERRSTDQFSSPSYNASSDFDAVILDGESGNPPASALLIRRLSASMTPETLNSMLLFASNLLEARFIQHSDLHDERGFQSAIALFSTLDSAIEVRDKLHGKPNAASDSTMIVEVIRGNERGPESLPRRTSDVQPRRPMSFSNHNGQGRPSRFTSAFQSLDHASPTRHSRGSGGSDLSNTEAGNSQNMHDLFSPQSPVKTYPGERHRNSVRAMTGDEATDDEESDLLSNPLAFAEEAQRQRNMHSTMSQFSNLRLDTTSNPIPDGDLISPKNTSYSANRQIPSTQAVNSAHSDYSNNFAPLSPNSNYSVGPQHYSRHQFPPANPADQNPPCNTLYVGNLPHETSEDELKSIFSRQRGYKRLCFRTKHNGPMCFVEFEDVSFATKALKELYGVTLHNSQRGGIRLSFSKNPLGVRNGQNNLVSPLSSPMTGFGNGGFGSISGPPPGLGFATTGSISSLDTAQSGHGLNIYAATSSHQLPVSQPSLFQNPNFPNNYMASTRGYGSVGGGPGDPSIRR